MSIYGKSDFMDFCEMHHTPEEVVLSERSYVDVAEEERLNIEMDSMKKYYHKRKRKKSEYTIEDAVKNFYGEYGMKSADEYDIKLAKSNGMW